MLVKLLFGTLYGALAVKADAGPYGVGTDPFWVVSHAPLTSVRLDPIVSPAGISGHTHQVVGGSAFGPVYDYAASQQAKCTSANVAIDKSNYWAPQLYRNHPNGTVSLVKLTYANTYYLTRKADGETVVPFPPGFRMLVGDPNRQTYNESDPTNAAISYACLGVSGPETPAFPTQSCPSNLRAQAFFPHCWDGINNWLPNSAHVAFSSEGNYNGGGKCPDSHPKRIMSLFYEWHYEDDFEYEAGARVWATGDTVGYSFHADFTMGWPDGYMQTIFDAGENCAVEFGLNKCPPLASHLQSNGGDCVVDKNWVDEDVVGPLSKLPGNNAEWGGSTPKTSIPNYVETVKLNSPAPTYTDGCSLDSAACSTSVGSSSPPNSATSPSSSTSSISSAPASGVSSISGGSNGSGSSSAASISKPTSSSIGSTSTPSKSSMSKSTNPGGGETLVAVPSSSSSAISKGSCGRKRGMKRRRRRDNGQY
ncbi:hypothetical protein M231_07112 [Tremella mesenterica]|uniref:DUF1996 domain-containing protein n=1 Tax=Tremella mesenterica TaxID=5217 RepID=A0A4Q1BA43_TREME|nr:hypothetical protein M231_07112 [Tremella mesenterica]